jgi:Beta-ketoacyl synthase, N-terminal domain
MRVFVESVGLLGPGLTGWSASRAALLGAVPYVPEEVLLPAPAALPAAERRRTGLPVRLALAVGLDALAQSARRDEALASVFTSSGADGQVIHEICEALTGVERQVSPTRFHNSVHNAPAGYWSIALRSHAPSTSLCCYDWSFAAGLLEAAAQCVTEGVPVLLVSYEVPYPEPLYATRPVMGVFGTALLLAPEATPEAIARIELQIEAGATATSVMQNQDLERLRTGNPAGRALPLLRVLAEPAARTILLEYLSDKTLRVEIKPL